MEKILLKNLYKVFGSNPDRAMALLNGGLSKEEVFKQTNNAVGVCDVSLSINEGEIFVVMGLSGSGKSTLVRLINRLIEPTSGHVFLDGTDIATLSKRDLMQLRRRDMSMVFQSFALMPHMNVIDNVSFGLELSGVGLAKRHERAMKALEQVNLKDSARSYPDELSGGMQQRVGLARALANDPSVMLMDEAFSALDPLIRVEMQDELLKIQQSHKRTIIFISHDLNEAMRIGDRIAIMRGGRVVQIGTPDDILNNPVDDYVRSFFRDVDVSGVLTVSHIMNRTPATVLRRGGLGLPAALDRVCEGNRPYGYVVGTEGEFLGVVSEKTVRAALQDDPEQDVSAAFIREGERLSPDMALSDAIGAVARAALPLPVVGQDNRFLGAVSQATLLACLDRKADKVDG